MPAVVENGSSPRPVARRPPRTPISRFGSASVLRHSGRNVLHEARELAARELGVLLDRRELLALERLDLGRERAPVDREGRVLHRGKVLGVHLALFAGRGHLGEAEDAEVDPHGLRHALHVLVAAAGEVDHNVCVLIHRLGVLARLEDRVGRLECWDDALALGQQLEPLQSLTVSAVNVVSATSGLEVGVLRANAGVVKACADRVRLRDLAVIALQQEGARAVEHAGPAERERGAVLVGVGARATCLHAEDAHLLVILEWVEHPDGVRATAHTRNDHIGELAHLLERLSLGLAANDRLEVAHDRGERVRADGRADDVVGGTHVSDPVAHRLVDRILERLRPARDAGHRGAEDLHAEHVECLTAHVLLAHVHGAVQVEQSAGSGSGHAVLARAGLRDDALLANALGKQALRERVVDLVRPSVREVLALEPNLGATDALGEPLGKVQRGRPTDVVAAECLKLQLELGILGGLDVDALEVLVRGLEGGGKKATAKFAKVRVEFVDGLVHWHGVSHLERVLLRWDVIGRKGHGG
mmetsp:Transcript_19494/g.49213  ORF Transcript_19494/g.49213 Transcript_19494/m.49213 type:complete len:530 (+) Transcript_19494:73-1662(+)